MDNHHLGYLTINRTTIPFHNEKSYSNYIEVNNGQVYVPVEAFGYQGQLMICAYKEAGEDTGRLLKAVLAEFKPELHRFAGFDQLTNLASDRSLDLIFISCSGDVNQVIALITKIRAIPILTFVPLVIQHLNHGDFFPMTG